MIVVASANGAAGIDAAWEVMAGGGSALDAVEAGTRAAEDDPDDHTVGYGGYPNLVGEVELDASIMEGATRRAGAVGALKGYRHAVTVARQVMERLPHVTLAGEGAARFAAEIGMEREDLLTEEAATVWRQGIEGRLPEEAVAARMLSAVVDLVRDPERAGGTVNFIARDGAGRMASAVSTSGWAWKYPGRLGDSPLIGAGNYADDRYGAAALTGWGELAVRAGAARTVVRALEDGAPLEAACAGVLRDAASLADEPGQAILHLVAVGADESHCAVSTSPGRTYVYRSTGMAAFTEVPRVHIEVGG